MTWGMNLYSDTSCGTLLWTVEFTISNINFGTQTTLTNGATGYNYTGIVQAGTWTAYTNSTVTALNNNNTCNITSWQLNQATDILGCNDSNNNSFPAQGSAFADKYSVSDNSLTTEMFSNYSFSK